MLVPRKKSSKPRTIPQTNKSASHAASNKTESLEELQRLQSSHGSNSYSCIVSISSQRWVESNAIDSSNIACEMVTIDDRHNGWRYIVLPMAVNDDLVCEAVLSASSYHFSVINDGQVYNPISAYSRVIRSLQQRQNLQCHDLIGKQGVILALLVLLTTVVVNGSSDFPTIFKLLESAVTAAGGEEAIISGELGRFLVRQVRKCVS